MIKLLKTEKEIKIRCSDINERGMQISVECEGFILEERWIAPEKVYFKLNEMTESLLIRLAQENIVSWDIIKSLNALHP